MDDKRMIVNIENRVRQLMDDHRRLVQVCAELTAERNRLLAENRACQERMREQEAELSRMQLCAGLTGDGRSRDKARARVNRLMREVDKCIALLAQAETDAGEQKE